jgi:hypothetical protein
MAGVSASQAQKKQACASVMIGKQICPSQVVGRWFICRLVERFVKKFVATREDE